MKTKTKPKTRRVRIKPSVFGPHKNEGFCAKVKANGNLMPGQTFAYTRREVSNRLGFRSRKLFSIVRAIVVDPRFYKVVPLSTPKGRRR